LPVWKVDATAGSERRRGISCLIANVQMLEMSGIALYHRPD
jgi:hypothetical protein